MTPARRPGRLSRALVVLALLPVAACGEHKRASRATPSPSAVVGTPSGTSSPAGATPWPLAKVLRRISGRRIRVAGRVVRIDPATVTCGGLGGPAGRPGGKAVWTRFRCVQPTFPKGTLVGPDVIFVAEPRGERALDVSGARLTHY